MNHSLAETAATESILALAAAVEHCLRILKPAVAAIEAHRKQHEAQHDNGGGLKLNLGCGNNRKTDRVNVDKYGSPDVRHDLEMFPWPWEDNSVALIELNHVLEHLGETTETYRRIWQEMYRVCRPGARIEINVPHHRHDFFANDPTHVRIITPDSLGLFDQRANKHWADYGYANSPLGQYWAVDFEILEAREKPVEEWQRAFPGGNPKFFCNSAEEVRIVMQAMKPERFPIERGPAS